MGTVEEIIRSSRPLNGLMAALAVWTGWAVQTGNPDPFDPSLIFLSLSAVMLLSGGNLINDVQDRFIDMRIHTDRSLVRGAITDKTLKRTAIGLWSLSLISTAIVSSLNDAWVPLLILDIAMLSLLWYELNLKRRGIIGNIIISSLTGATFLFGASLHGSIPPMVLIFALMAAVINLSRELLKDIEDMEGDISLRETYPILKGKKRSVSLARTIVWGALVLSLLPFLMEKVNPIYLVIIALSDMFFILSLIIMERDPSSSQKRIKIGMVLALIAFFSFSMI